MLPVRNGNKAYTDEQFTAEQVKSVLQECGISIGSELETHYLIYCPFHYNVNTPACEVDKTKGLFICFSCNEKGSLFDIVTKTTGRKYFEARRFINGKSTETVNIAETIETNVEPMPEFQPFDMELINSLHEQLLKSDRAKSYLYNRGINDFGIKNFLVGYSEKQDMITVPVYSPEGLCVGFVGRSIEGKVFKNSINLPRNKTLFNLSNVKYTSDVVVVESSFDCIRLWQLCIPAVATLGAMIGSRQISLMSKYLETMILAMDHDDAGKSLENKIKQALPNKSISSMEFPDNYKDVGAMSDESIKHYWRKSSEFDELLSF